MIGSGCFNEIDKDEEHFDDFFNDLCRKINYEDDLFALIDGITFASLTQNKNGLFFRFIAYLHDDRNGSEMTLRGKIPWCNIVKKMQDNLEFLAGLDCTEHDHILSFANPLYQYFGIDQSHLFPTVFSYDKIHDTRNLASYEYFLDDVGLTDHEHALGVFFCMKEKGFNYHADQNRGLNFEETYRILADYFEKKKQQTNSWRCLVFGKNRRHTNNSSQISVGIYLRGGARQQISLSKSRSLGT